MAEGAEETESSNADTPAMLGAVLPCEAITASIGGMKREFDTISRQSSSPTFSTSLTTATATATTAAPIAPLSSIKGSSTVTATAATRTASPSPSSSSSSSSPTSSSSSISAASGNVQQHPINLKSEESDKELCSRLRAKSSTPPAASMTDNENDRTGSEYYKSLGNITNNDRSSPHDQSKVSAVAAAAAAAAAAQVHLNGTMQDMINLQKLQNLASLQQQHKHQSQQQQHQQQQQQHQHVSVPVAALAGLQGLAGISSAAALNSPLNLSVGSSSTLSTADTMPSSTGALGGTGGTLAGCAPSAGSQMPQLILASGQLVQGVQGAQLLIPTSQGIAVQTILTIPVSQQVNASESFFQNYAGLSGSTAPSPFNSAPLAPHQIPLPTQPSYFKPNLFSTSVQQLLAALHPHLFPAQQGLQTHSHAPHQSQTQQQSSHLTQFSKHQSITNHLHQQDRVSPKVEQPSSSQSQSHHREPSPIAQGALHMRASPLANLSTVQHPKESPTRSSSFGLHLAQAQTQSQGQVQAQVQAQAQAQEKSRTATSPPATNSYASPSGSQLFHTHSPNSHMTSSSHSLSSQVNSPSSACVLSSINRLTSTNGELTITKSHVPPSHSMTASSSSPSPSSTHHHQNQPMKLSPSSMHLSPTGTEASTTDLLVDSPNEPTINQTNCNVVDGIDLDEIKEFAKAFKLRRLSLGLTQTQVGQALSVTEGPAYSQSAICSALAAQMYAAQLSSQQQNMFEKLDITPKSAQKIKPVLERWMKEAEESHWNRYKTGQNHLTDFIGVEPSKKRKRRTSFTPQALELLNAHFERNTHPSGTEITGLAHQLGYEREVIRIWFCNKRQALKNTVRMMSKGMV